MLEELNRLEGEALKALEAAEDEEALDQWYRAYLGRKGAVTQMVRSVGTLPKEERPAFGRRANEVKQALEAAYADRREAVRRAALARALEEGAVDVTLPGRPVVRGRLHPATRTLREIYAIFAEMGFQVYRSRDVETDEYNFQLLNMPPHHPARDMWDTFYTTREGVLLRTHTSPGQIHAMREFAPEPVRVILPGMCYRYEQITARSEIQFHQVEGLAVGRNITMTDLKGTLAEFARRMFGPERRMRFRCSHFPFTEPSVEVDIDCILCEGEGCPVCKHTGWLEILGAGMVHPVVLRNGGYDPAVYSGFAFGMGPERITMLKYGIGDIRYFWGNDLRFLEQF
ncbi:MAG TPA: phenylalanine--tRNA ligase subunit alpha [Anaerolineales bacterium]|nr:phenylalanine--tRNA ligase subunit alpha [Anaerolineales bacterium]